MFVSPYAQAGPPPSKPSLKINEIRVDQNVGEDDITEYFELTGDPGLPMTGYTYVVLGDPPSGQHNSGVIEAIVPLQGALNAEGRWLVAQPGFPLAAPDQVTSLNFEDVDSVTHLLVAGFSGANGQDLDTNEDGILDIMPWTAVIDAVGLLWQPQGPIGYAYGASLGFVDVGPYFANIPPHVYRGSDCGGWYIDFDLLLDTPGMANPLCPPPPPPFGLTHVALGAAAFEMAGGKLSISDIGSSGEDGVSIALGAAEGWLGAIDLGPAGGLPPGMQVKVQSSLQIGDQDSDAQLVVNEVDNGQASVSFGIVNCDGCSLTVEAIHDGAVVDTVTTKNGALQEVARGGFGSSGNQSVTLRNALTSLNSAHDLIMLLTNPSPVQIALTGSSIGPVLAESIRVRSLGVPSGRVTNHVVNVTAANIPGLLISDEATIQFEVENRGRGEALMTGDIESTSNGGLLLTNLDAALAQNGVSIRLPSPELFGSQPEQHTRVRVGLSSVPPPGFGPIVGGWTVRGQLTNGTQAVLGSAGYGILRNGDLVMLAFNIAWLVNETATIVALLDGDYVGQLTSFGVTTHDAANWPPNAIEYELLGLDSSSTGAFRIIYRWDNPITIILSGNQSTSINELRILVSGALGPNGNAADVNELIVNSTQVFHPALVGDDAAILIKDFEFLTPDFSCAADVSGNGSVNVDDLIAIILAWGPCPNPCSASCAADLNQDCAVNVDDLLAVISNWGPCP